MLGLTSTLPKSWISLYRPSTIDRPSTLVCHSFAPQTRRIIWRQRPNHRSLPSHPPPTPPIDAHRPDRNVTTKSSGSTLWCPSRPSPSPPPRPHHPPCTPTRLPRPHLPQLSPLRPLPPPCPPRQPRPTLLGNCRAGSTLPREGVSGSRCDEG